MTSPLERLADYLVDLKSYRIPFDKYGPHHCPPNGRLIHELPLEYLVWFRERGGGFPTGRLGELMEFVYQVKSVGAGEVFLELTATDR